MIITKIFKSDHRKSWNTSEINTFFIASKILMVNTIFLLLLTVYRAGFLLYFGRISEIKSLESDIWLSFLWGLRFDLQITCYLNFIPILGVLFFILKQSFFSTKKSSLKLMFILRNYYLVVYLLTFFVMFTDFGFYSYFHDHINILIFGIWEDDTIALVKTILTNYNVPLAVFGLVVFYISFTSLFKICYLLIEIPVINEFNSMNIFAKIVFIIFLLGINVLGARGTIKTFPLNIEMAAFSTNQFINQLSINGVHALQKAIQLRFNSETREGDLVVQRGFKTPEDAFKTRYYISNIDNNLTKLETYMWRETPLNLVLAKEKPNVVVILVESLGSQWLKLNSPSFNLMGELAKHFNTDPVFYNFLSSDRGTIGSLMALTTNLPTRPGFAHFTESKYLTLKFPSGAQVPYELNNYETSFLYGGDSSWRGIGKFMHNQGYTNVEGAAEIEKAFHDNSDLRHVWGVHDEYLYKYLAQKLTKATKPQFIFALSTTNHPPYKIPDNYQPLPIQFPEILTSKLQSDSTLVVERMRAFQYSCQKLGEFLTELKASPLGENTIVAITGDHNFWSFLNYNTEEVLSQYGVPFYLYVPQKLLPKGFKINSEIFGSQIDIMPTLYNLSLSQTKYIAMGENLLLQKPNVNVRNYAFNSVNQVLGKEGALLDGKFYTWNKDIPGILNKEAINSDNIRTFDQYYGATLAVTDYYIKTLLVRKK